MASLLLPCVVCLFTTTASALPAFPGAEGFGANATGGRGGTVVHVTNLNASGPGSFADAVSQGRRVVVFDVGGNIKINSELHVANDITIAGQTAPGEGVAIFGQPVSCSASHNIIVRHIRFRQGIDSNQHKSALMITKGSNMIFDHVSIEWGRWDTIDMTGSSDITFQHCIIGEGIAPQRFGCLCESDNVTFSHNLWINNHSRNPKAKGRIQYVNNVIYNYGIGFVGGHSAADHYVDVINNYIIKGPSSGKTFMGEFAATDKVYQSGNYVDLDCDGALNGRLIAASDIDKATLIEKATFNPEVPVFLESAEAAYHRIVAGVGASLHRDAIDRRLVDALTSLGKRGEVISDPAAVGGPGVLKGGETLLDTDGDGMPDEWESKNGSDPKTPDGNSAGKDGYTKLENYLNSLADQHPKE